MVKNSREAKIATLKHTLTDVFKHGYRPARKITEPYAYVLPNGVKVSAAVNCFGHAVFNLRNQQFLDYNLGSFPLFGSFDGICYDPKNIAENRLMDFIRSIGLKVADCDPAKLITRPDSWKVALHFEDSNDKRDFHLLLEEAPGLWSSKIGFEPCLEHVYQVTPPGVYRNLEDDDPTIYNFYATYQITNPNYSSDNPYLKDFNFNPVGLKVVSPQRQVVVEDGREDNYAKMLENLCAARGLI